MQTNVKTTQSRRRGSALIMAIVITMLLFIIGIVFVLTSQKGRAIVTGSEFRQSLDAGTDAVIEQINTVLIQDLFGTSGTARMLDGTAGNEYWDYPGDNDPWLASLEPDRDDQGTATTADDTYYWRHISDLYGNNFNINVVNLPSSNLYYDPTDDKDDRQWDGSTNSIYYLSYDGTPATATSIQARIISDEDSTYLIGEDGDWDDPDDYCRWGGRADADGDGVADSRWAQVPGVTGPQGQNVYTAVRIVDNGGMINANTAYYNDDTSQGKAVAELNLTVLARPSFTEQQKIRDINDLHAYKTQTTSPNTSLYPAADIEAYYNEFVLHMDDPIPTYPTLPNPVLPFELSDELELKNRFFLNSNVITDLENTWPSYLVNGYKAELFVEGEEENWYEDLKWLNDNLDRRHLMTTYSWDRTIRGYSTATTAPVAGFAAPSTGTAPPITLEGLQADINHATAEEIATALIHAYQNAGFGDADQRQRAAQWACNIVDYRDGDSDVTSLYYASTGTPGTEDAYVFGHAAQPYIVELRAEVVLDVSNNVDPTASSFELDLYNPYSRMIEAAALSEFILRVYDETGTTQIGNDIDLSTVISSDFASEATETVTHSDLVFAEFTGPFPGGTVAPTIIALIRVVDSQEVLLDRFECPDMVSGDWLDPGSGPQIETRSMTWWDTHNLDLPPTAQDFTSVGEAEQVLTVGPEQLKVASDILTLEIIEDHFSSGPAAGRLNFETNAEENQDLLSYLTVLTRIEGTDNDGDGVNDDRDELRIPGRININTAPARVLAALPWIKHLDTNPAGITEQERYLLAQAIVAYRDKLDLSNGGNINGAPDYATQTRAAAIGSTLSIREDAGFANIAELVNVTATTSLAPEFYYDIRRFGKDNADPIVPVPYDSTADSVNDDLEERDILFQRVSNLVTVRSDVFTAYIAIRVGEEGPMRRVIAIFDRSKVFSPADKPRLVALHPVPDPS